MTTPNTPPTSPSARSSVAADGVPVSISVGAALALALVFPRPRWLPHCYSKIGTCQFPYTFPDFLSKFPSKFPLMLRNDANGGSVYAPQGTTLMS